MNLERRQTLTNDRLAEQIGGGGMGVVRMIQGLFLVSLASTSPQAASKFYMSDNYPEILDAMSLGRIIDQVLTFIRIMNQVVELVRAVRIPVDVLPVGRAYHPAVAVLVIDDDGIASRSPSILQGRQEGPTWQIGVGQWEIDVIQKSRHEVVGRNHGRLHEALWNGTWMRGDEGYLDGVLVHVDRAGSISLAPEAMMATRVPIVRSEHDQGVLAQASFLELVQDASHVQVHGGYGCEVPL